MVNIVDDELRDHSAVFPNTRAAVVVERRPAVQSSLYGSSASNPLPSTMGSTGCELVVTYKDDGATETISAAQAPKPAAQQAFDDYAWLGILGLYGMMPFIPDSSSGPAYQGRFDKMHGEYTDAIDSMRSSRSDDPPPSSGEYWGASSEDDDGDQAVRVTFEFKGDGQLAGHGKDGEDGAYKIRGGEWAPLPNGKVAMAWRENYDQGFTTVCIGTINTKTGKVEARFVSSRNVSGDFTLTKKPDIF